MRSYFQRSQLREPRLLSDRVAKPEPEDHRIYESNTQFKARFISAKEKTNRGYSEKNRKAEKDHFTEPSTAKRGRESGTLESEIPEGGAMIDCIRECVK